MVTCENCGSEMNKAYSDDDINSDDPFFKLEMKRFYKCPECGDVKRLSDSEIVKEFVKSQLKAGKSKRQIVKDVIKKKKEIKEIEK